MENQKDKVVVWPHRVQYYETDGMRIVHHSNYIRWFEEARVDWMERMGFGYDCMEQHGISAPVIGITCQYHSPALFGETVEVCASVIKLSPVRMEFHYEVYDEQSGVLRVEGSSSHCFTNSETGKPIRLNRTLPEVYDLFVSSVRERD